MQSILPKQKFFLAAAIVLGMGLSLAEPAYAAGSNMPWAVSYTHLTLPTKA